MRPFSWSEYVPALLEADWYRRKYARLASLAHEPRRYHPRLAELTLEEIDALDTSGRSAGWSRPGGHSERTRDRHAFGRPGEEGNGKARDYRRGLEKLGAQGGGDPAAASTIHESIRHGIPVDFSGLVAPTGAAASAMMYLVAGGAGATAPAMRAVQKWRTGRANLRPDPAE